MNAISRPTLEEMIGLQMAALARKEGHTQALPRSANKVEQKPNRRHANTRVGIENRKRVMAAIRRGVRTAPHIASVLNMPSGSARKACRDLEQDGKIKRDGFIAVNGSNTTLWSIVTP